ncbi:MAG: isoleucine--tRNA ligase [Longimicrobiales bacterium]
MKYPDYPTNTTALENEILESWRSEDLFRRTLEQTEGAEEFVFFEGPPTANGRPGIHHVISRTIKDLVCRYQTMHGRHVTRIAGWDTHGLPVEIEAEKKLGISGKRQIEEIGVARFNAVCRESVFTYKEDWEKLSERIGYWLDYSKPYVTMDPRYIESVWNVLQQLDSRGLIYRGYRSVPYCPRCGTSLSSHEVAQGYEDVADPSIYFTAPLESDPSRAFLVWTTTPWTLPANAALALNPSVEYVEVEWAEPQGGVRTLILAESRVAALFGEDVKRVRTLSATELEGTRYVRPFDILKADATGKAWQVVLEDFVTSGDGTGIVHMAPAYGADDYAAGLRHELPMMRAVDDTGRFKEDVPLVAGMFVKDADAPLVQALRDIGRVFRYSLEVHSYPHCWRCSSPLLYMARDSWYIRTTAVRAKMIENNAQVGWHPPEVGSGRFGEWLEGNVDWAISRERYWGTPLPIWVCSKDPEHREVIGSYAELAQRAGTLPADFDPHKPFIDEYEWPCECGGTRRRIPEVVDVWFDSGAMPYAQWHYPFENSQSVTHNFPADFVCEGIDQTRGWFYSLMAISTMLDLGPAYKHVLVNDLLLDVDGLKMSKSRGNVVDPWQALETFGADAIRWYFMTVSQPWVPKRFDPAALGESARRTFDTLANTYRFFAMYANLENWRASEDDPQPASRAVQDRWILARLDSLVSSVTADFDAYEITRASRAISDFIVDDLSNWYVRRSRDRFWGSADAADTAAAFRTLHETIVVLSRLLAPVTPFQSDWLHRALTGTSVHLAPYPAADPSVADAGLEAGMDVVRILARLGRAARERVKIRVRQPLGTLQAVVAQPDLLSEELLDVLRDELNVKRVEFLQGAEELVALRANPRFRDIGKRFGSRTQAAAVLIRDLPAESLRAIKARGSADIVLDDETHGITLADVDVLEEATGDSIVETESGCTIALDATIDDALRSEGLARELVNRVQRLRRESGFEVSDRIRLTLSGDGEITAAAQAHGDYIAGETLATHFSVEDTPGGGIEPMDVDGHAACIEIAKA